MKAIVECGVHLHSLLCRSACHVDEVVVVVTVVEKGWSPRDRVFQSWNTYKSFEVSLKGTKDEILSKLSVSFGPKVRIFDL